MSTRQSTPEEIERKRVEIAAAECRGDGIHTNDMRFWHDWRLHERTGVLVKNQDGKAPSFIRRETWYCTRCQVVREREVPG